MSTRAATWPSGIRVVWRTLTWGEYRKVSSIQGPPAEKALEVYKLSIVDGPRVDEIPAGIMMWVFRKQMDENPFSGTFQTLSGPLQQARDNVTGSFLLTAQGLIASVLRVPFEIMESWDSETFLTRLAQAEFIAGVPLNPVDPNAAKNKKGAARRQKKPLTKIQQMAVDRRYGPGSADALREQGDKPSQVKDTEVETFSYTK